MLVGLITRRSVVQIYAPLSVRFTPQFDFKTNLSRSYMLALIHAYTAFCATDIVDRPKNAAVFGSLIPNIDILLNLYTPFVRNGITHSIIFALFCGILVQTIFGRRKITEGFVIGTISHLSLDLLTMNGLMLFFPAEGFFSFNLISGYRIVSNLAILAFCTFATVEKRTEIVREIVNSILQDFGNRSMKR